MCHFLFKAPQLEEFLSDETRRHTAFCDLPIDLRNVLMVKRKYMLVIGQLLCIYLPALGLMSVGDCTYRKLDEVKTYIVII